MNRVHTATVLVALAFAIVSAAEPAMAQGPKGPKVKTQVAGTTAKAPRATAPKTGGSAKAAKSTTAKADAPKLASRGRADKGAAAETASGTATGTASTGTTTDTTTGTTAGTSVAAEPNAISTRIARNPSQKARIEAMLPQGMTLEAASAGFRNQGQFIAAVNASKSQGVSFDALKTAMTVDGMSLGQAVKHAKSAPPSTGTATTPGTGTTTGTGTDAAAGTGTGTGTGATTGGTATGTAPTTGA